MPVITFSQPDGALVRVDAPVGRSVMEIAIQNNVSGIEAECGGCLDCATCHVYVDPAYVDLLPPPTPAELEMLSGVTAERLPTSRLSCQLSTCADLRELAVTIPEKQI